MQGSKSDHILAVVKAATNLIPVIGGSIASLIGDYIPSSTQRALNRTVEILGEKIGTLQDRVDVDLVDKDEFSELFKAGYLVAAKTHREEKLHAVAALLANLLLKPNDPAKLPYEELDHFVRCLDSLSIGAITLLGAARTIKAVSPISTGGFSFGDLHRLFSTQDHSLTMSLVSELRSMNLVRVQEPAIRVAQDENYLIDLTPIGRRFIERIIEGTV